MKPENVALKDLKTFTLVFSDGVPYDVDTFITRLIKDLDTTKSSTDALQKQNEKLAFEISELENTNKKMNHEIGAQTNSYMHLKKKYVDLKKIYEETIDALESERKAWLEERASLVDKIKNPNELP